MSVELAHAGQCTIMHHQYYQMVDLLIECCKKSMGGLNPHAAPCAPSTSRIVAEESAKTKKKNNNNFESSKWNKSSKWNTCRTKKGRRNQNNNKNIKEKNMKIVSNRFSRLQETTQDAKEVMDRIEKAVDEIKHATINEEKEESKENMHDADIVDINTLDAETHKCAEHDKQNNNNNDELSENKTNNIEKDENINNNEGSQVPADLDANINEINEESEHDSEKERLACYALHPDSESECADSESSSESFDEYIKCPSDSDYESETDDDEEDDEMWKEYLKGDALVQEMRKKFRGRNDEID